MKNFSIVIPVKGKDYLEQNLPSWSRLNPEEILLCYDKPVPEDSVEIVEAITQETGANIKIVSVGKNNDYAFNQAWVRRKGFLKAKNDIILTGDIDLHVYTSCLKAIAMVGQNDIGLVSLLKIRTPKGMQGKMRGFIDKHLRKIMIKTHNILARYLWNSPEVKKPSYFTGLYALYRPFWLETEDDKIQKLQDPKSASFLPNQWGGYEGEDTFLKNCMIKTYRCLFLSDIGAEDFGVGLEETRPIQLKIGKYYLLEGEKLLAIIKDSIFHLRPYVLGSYIHCLTKIFMNQLQPLIEIIRESTYVFVHAFLRLVFGRDRRDQLFEKYQLTEKLDIDHISTRSKEVLNYGWLA